MSSRSDSVRSLRRSRLRIDTVGCAAAVACLWWAGGPLERTEPAVSVVAAGAESATSHGAEADFPVSVFDRTLWHVPPAPVIVEAPRLPDMPRLGLLGVMRNGDGFRAMIVDLPSGEIQSVSAGDAFGVTRVVAVGATVVRCEAHGVPFELSLEGP